MLSHFLPFPSLAYSSYIARNSRRDIGQKKKQKLGLAKRKLQIA